MSPALLGLLAVALLTSGCGGTGGDPQASGPEVALRAAVERTLEARTLRVVRTQPGVSEAAGGTMVSEYQAPDRGRSVTSGDRSTEIRVVGSALYLSTPARDGLFTVRTEPGETNLAAANVLLPLQALLGAQNVTEAGGVYLVEGVRGSAEAHVSDGYVTRVRLRWEREANRFDADYELSGFDAALPPIDAPGDDRLVPPASPHPTCPEGDEAPALLLCTSPIPAHVPTVVDLPDPVGPIHSTIQIRPVVSTAPVLSDTPRCRPDGTNPEPAAPSRVPGRANCYQLGPAQTQIVRAGSVEAVSRPGAHGDLSSYFTENANVDLHVSLAEGDADRIRIVADRNPGGIVLVTFGRVLAAEEVSTTDGAIVLPDLTPQFASRVKAALSGSRPPVGP